MAEGFKKSVLSNGVRVLTESVDSVGSASIGVWCATGSRHEREDEGGITHLIEHMLFKGTKTRTAHNIADEIEGRGGMLNAFTDKERTCYYCRVLAEDTAHSLDVLTDMVTNSLIDGEELQREKGVVLEEIKRSEDEPSDQVHDLHLEGMWPDHQLGRPVIGTKELVSSFQREHLVSYIDRRYRGSTLVVSAAGKVDHDEVVRAVEDRLGSLESSSDSIESSVPVSSPGNNMIAKDIEQVHFCIGTSGIGYLSDDLYPMIVMDAVLGGGMSSRLFQEIREKRGLAYAIGSYHLTYTEGGAYGIYGGTGIQTWQEVQDVVRVELDKMMKEGPTSIELEKAKRQIAGNLVLGLEGMSSRMMRQAKNEIVYGRYITMDETVKKINAVSMDEVIQLSRRMFHSDQMRTTAIGPFGKQ